MINTWIRRSKSVLFIVVACIGSAALFGCTATPPTPPRNPFQEVRIGGTVDAAAQLPEQSFGVTTTILPQGYEEFDWDIPEEAAKAAYKPVYAGEPVTLHYDLSTDWFSTPAGAAEMGLTLYLNGVPQPFTVQGREDLPACEQPVEDYRFLVKPATEYILTLTFTPVCGKAGDILPLLPVYTFSPSFKVTQMKECSEEFNWMRSSSGVTASLHMQQDAPQQLMVDTAVLDTGTSFQSEDGYYMFGNILENKENRDNAARLRDGELDERFAGDTYIMRLDERGHLSVILCGRTSCTPRYRIQLRLDGKAAAVFDGKYYADVILPDAGDQMRIDLLTLDIDMHDYPDVHTVQLFCVPLAEDPEVVQHMLDHMARVVSTNVCWIRYD